MLNLLLAAEESLVYKDIYKSLSKSADYSLSYFNDIKSAVDYCKDNPVDVAFVCVTFDYTYDNDLTRAIYECNFECSFVYIYNDASIEEALSLFNYYCNSKLIHSSLFDKEHFVDLVNSYSELFFIKQKRNRQNMVFRDKEKTYQQKLLAMSSLLNSRIACYQNVFNTYILSICELINIESARYSDLYNYFEIQLNNYLNLFLKPDIDMNVRFDELANKYLDKDNKKFFMLNNERKDDDSFSSISVLFCFQVICDIFYDFLNSYFGVVILKKTDGVDFVDIKYEVRDDIVSSDNWVNICSFVNDVVKSYSQKCEVSHLEGKMQYRLWFK